MRRLPLLVVLISLLVMPWGPSRIPPSLAPTPPLTTAHARVAYGQVALSFEANTGQLDPSVNFVARGGGYALHLTPTAAVFALGRSGQSHGSSAAPTVLRIGLI